MSKDPILEMKRHIALALLGAECEESSEDELQFLGRQLLYQSDDDDEALVLNVLQQERIKRKCSSNNAADVLPECSDTQFRESFRIGSDLYNIITNRFEKHSTYMNLRIDKRLAATKYILVFLWFAGHEACSYRDVADKFGICIATVCRVIHRVTLFLCDIAEGIIGWPNNALKQLSNENFLRNYGLPNTIGVIDVTRVFIEPPRTRGEQYVDSQGECSICIQGICNEENKFLDVFIGYPGAVDDATVFRNSYIYANFDELVQDNTIVGSSSYPVMANLLTPYKDDGNLSASQIQYNEKLYNCKKVIDQTFLMLKQRFRQLYRCKIRDMNKLCLFVKACCVLHNMANKSDFPFVKDTNAVTENYVPAGKPTSCEELGD